MGRARYLGTKSVGALNVGGAPVAADAFTLGDRTYTFQVAAANNLEITIGGTNADTANNIIAAVNANAPSVGILAEIDPVTNTCVRFSADTPGTAGDIALTEAVTDAGFTVSAATLTDGQNADFLTLDKGIYVVTALDVAVTSVVIKTSLAAPTLMSYNVFSATGLFKGTLSNLITISGSDIRHDFTGATDVVAGDLIHWVVVA
jgi:hypothetical protein